MKELATGGRLGMNQRQRNAKEVCARVSRGRLMILLSFFAAFLSPLWAQVTGSISGHLEDATGAGVGGATITVTSLETGAKRTATSDENGNYQITSLPLG